MRQGSVLFYVEPGGRITLASDRGRKVLRELGRRTPSSVEDDLGVSFARLADAARDGVRLPTLLGFVDVDALIDPAGKSVGILVRAEEAVSKSLGRTDEMFTILLGDDPALRAAVELAEGYALTELPVLIVAEPGAGGLKLAHWVHATSERSDRPLYDVDGHSLTIPIAENETLRDAKAGSTVFVRSLEAMTEGAQRQLARALDGGVGPRGFLQDVRLIAWSSADIRGRSGTSHELARLMRASTVALPPLRDRTDRTVVAERLLEAIAPGSSLSAAAKRGLDAYAFPGNLSELEVALQRAAAHAGERRVIEPEDLPAEILDATRGHGGTMESAERAALEEAMRLSHGNLSRAAKRLGISRATLYRKIKKYEVVA